MDKNWLIRTKSNHILGPVSKEKVVELYENGSIKPDDEICSGNGYWFFIREDDLVNRFLLGSETQSFNPISEAKNVLTTIEESLPKEDLENDITLVGGINMAMLKEEAAPKMVTDSPLPEIPEGENRLPKSSPTVPSKKKNRLDEKIKARKVYHPPKQQNWLKYLGVIGFLVLFLLVYFRKAIIQNFFEDEFASVEVSLFPSAHAEDSSSEKKKSFLSPK
jgi:hypothetical protein